MIFKAFKRKSNQNYVKKLLNSRNVALDQAPIESVGIILNLKEYGDLNAFRAFFTELGILPVKVKIITFVEDNAITEKLWDTYISPKDFGWKGHIKNVELQTFIETKFDALVCFHKLHPVELDIVTAASNSKFKIGISNDHLELYDFVIDIDTTQFDIFKNELKKYLTILNKLECANL